MGWAAASAALHTQTAGCPSLLPNATPGPRQPETDTTVGRRCEVTYQHFAGAHKQPERDVHEAAAHQVLRHRHVQELQGRSQRPSMLQASVWLHLYFSPVQSGCGQALWHIHVHNCKTPHGTQQEGVLRCTVLRCTR